MATCMTARYDMTEGCSGNGGGGGTTFPWGLYTMSNILVTSPYSLTFGDGYNVVPFHEGVTPPTSFTVDGTGALTPGPGITIAETVDAGAPWWCVWIDGTLLAGAGFPMDMTSFATSNPDFPAWMIGGPSMGSVGSHTMRQAYCVDNFGGSPYFDSGTFSYTVV